MELDADDNEYLLMLNEEKFTKGNFISKETDLERFLYNIFDQDYVSSFRRPSSQRSERKLFILKFESFAISISKYLPKIIKSILHRFIRNINQ
jgi:hypothetical protein